MDNASKLAWQYWDYMSTHKKDALPQSPADDDYLTEVWSGHKSDDVPQSVADSGDYFTEDSDNYFTEVWKGLAERVNNSYNLSTGVWIDISQSLPFLNLSTVEWDRYFQPSNSTTLPITELSLKQNLAQLDAYLYPPLIQATTRVFSVILLNIIFYNLVFYVQKLTSDPFFYPILAFVFGLLNFYIYSSWEVLQLVTGIAFANGVIFEIVMQYWKSNRADTEVTVLLKKANSLLKFLAIITPIFALIPFYHYEGDATQFIVPLVHVTAKLIFAAEDILRRKAEVEAPVEADSEMEEELTPEEEEEGDAIKFKTFLEVAAYVAFPSWMSFKDFQGLPHKQHVRGFRWRFMIVACALKAVGFHILSFKFLDHQVLGNIWGRPILLFIVHGFQQRCRYYYRAQLMELEMIALGIKRGSWEGLRLFNFGGAEGATSISEFLVSFNYPLGSYARQGFLHGRIGESLLLFGLGPLMTIFSYDYYVGCLWFFFLLSICNQAICLVGIGSRISLWRYVHNNIYLNSRRRGPAPPVQLTFSARLLLIVYNQFRLAGMFNAYHQPGMAAYTIATGFIFDTVCLTLVFRMGLVIYEPRRRRGNRRR